MAFYERSFFQMWFIINLKTVKMYQIFTASFLFSENGYYISENENGAVRPSILLEKSIWL